MCVVLDGSPEPILDFALRIPTALAESNKKLDLPSSLQVRIGVSYGACYGSVIGSEISRFHLFGRAHDHAIAIEQAGVADTVLVSQATIENTTASFAFALVPGMTIMNESVCRLIGRKPLALAGAKPLGSPGISESLLAGNETIADAENGSHSSSCIDRTHSLC